jgi:hypothetical protein
MDFTRYRGGLAERFVDLLPIDFLRARSGAERRHRADRDYIDNTHD